MFKKSLLAFASVALVAAPVAAQNPAAALSIAPSARAGASVAGNDQLEGGSIIAPLLFATIVVLGVLTATGTLFDEDNDDDFPVSA